MDHETYILAPSQVVDKARQLANAGLYQQALELLNRNQVIAEVYATRVEMRVPQETETKRRKQRELVIGAQRSLRTKRRTNHAPPAG